MANLHARRPDADCDAAISLCMIVRDAAATLAACLQSVRPWVDEMIVVDTGSTDATPQVAANLGAQVHRFSWRDDFAAARNASLRYATGDWAFYIDADETIDAENGRRLRGLVQDHIAPDVLAFSMLCRCSGSQDVAQTDVEQTRLFRIGRGLAFEGRVREHILPSVRRAEGRVASSDVEVLHSGADYSSAGCQRRLQRDLTLLELDLRDRPAHPLVLFYLGSALAEAGDRQRAAQYLSQAIFLAHPAESHVRQAYACLTACLTELERPDAACEVARKGRALFPDDRELAFLFGVAAQAAGRPQEAVAAYRTAITDSEQFDATGVVPPISVYTTRHNLALAHQALGELSEATKQWKLVIAEAPDFAPAWRGVGQALLEQGKRFEAGQLAESMSIRPGLEVHTLLLQAELAESAGDLDAQRQLLKAGRNRFPEDDDLEQAYCRFVFENGPTLEAEAALLHLVHQCPDDAAALHNLGLLYLGMGHLRAAVDRMRDALRLRPQSLPSRRQLAEALIQLGRSEEAQAELRRALQIAPDDGSIRSMLDDLERQEPARDLDQVPLLRRQNTCS